MSKRVVILTPMALSADTRSFLQASAFARFGYQCTVVQGAVGDFRESDLSFDLITLSSPAPAGPAADRRRHVPSWRAACKRLSPAWLWQAMTFAWFLYFHYVGVVRVGLGCVPRADLYVLHEYRLYPLVRRLCRRDDARFIYDAHDFYPAVHQPDQLSGFWRTIFMPFLNRMEDRCVRQADAFVTVSDGIARLLSARHGRDPAVIRNVPDPRLEQPADRDLRSACGVGGDVFLIAVMGNRKPGQAVGQMLSALSLMPPHVHVAFVGAGFEDVAREAAALGCGGRAHGPGVVPTNQAVSFLRGADAAAILYFPHTENYTNALPNGFLQSVAAGLPILFPPLPEIERLAHRYQFGRPIDPLNPESIAAAVNVLLDDGDLLAALRGKALAAARELSYVREEEVLKALASKLIGGPSE